jgi:type II secretory pathway pseudopilin PulG
MKTQPTAIVLLIIIGVILLSQISKYLLNIWQNKEYEKLQKERQYEYQKNNEEQENKVVLSVQNDNSSKKKVYDVNDIQNLNPKYTKNVYRDSTGRFKSKKKTE